MINLGELRQQVMYVSDDLQDLAMLVQTINREYDSVKQQLDFITQGSNKQEHRQIIDGLSAIQEELSDNCSNINNVVMKLNHIVNSL